MGSQSGGQALGKVSISRAELAENTQCVLSEGGWGNPDVLLVQLPRGGDGLVVVKDFAPRSRVARVLFGRWLLRREERAYRLLAELAAVPRLLGRIDEDALVLEYRPGTLLSRSLAARLPDNFMQELESAIAGMHAQGLVHLDLRHRSNILATDEGKPVLIDFASALFFPQTGRIATWLFRAFARIDLAAIEKWRVRLVPR